MKDFHPEDTVNMVLTQNYEKDYCHVDQIQVDNVYPISILERKQHGEVFVDDINNPKTVLFWHYCGFAYIAGTPDRQFLCEIMSFMKNPRKDHSDRLVLLAGKNQLLTDSVFIDNGINKEERYMFDYIGETQQTFNLDAGIEVEKIDRRNYHLINGRIIPRFSWKSEEEFLEGGFGFCVRVNGEFAACAFSSGISEEYCDIGVETLEKYRGKGLGKIVSAAMVKESVSRNLTPVWACSTKNIGSMKLACAVGFRVRDIHPIYKI